MQLDTELSTIFKIPLQVMIATARLPLENLSVQELQYYNNIPTQQQQSTWLLGRAALKRLLSCDNQFSSDTSGLAFPHRQLSLSHKSNLAIAIKRHDNQANGIGVDFERTHIFKSEWAQFFMTLSEKNLLQKKAPDKQPALLCSYWSIKEAVYKADLNNKYFDLIDYEINGPISKNGIAINVHTGQQFHYFYKKMSKGILAIALPGHCQNIP